MGTFTGNAANNTLNGTAADDIFKGFGGADTINGGAGKDLALYGDSSSGVTVSLATGAGLGGSAEGDVLTGIEDLGGSGFDDTLVGNDQANALQGNGGDDILKGGGGVDELYGNTGDDTLKGGGGGDWLYGGDGSDTVSYSDANARVSASLTYAFTQAGDALNDHYFDIENLVGSPYDDNLAGDANNNELSGGAGSDYLHGEGGNDTLRGGDGLDYLFGDGGDDVMMGGAGNDQYTVDSLLDIVIENAGEGTFDFVSSYVSFVLPANVEHLLLEDAATAVSATGNGDDNRIYGNDYDNILNGGGGNDMLRGEGGRDELYGGAGADTFVWTNTHETSTSVANADVIWDFGAGDVIDLSLIDADVYTAGNQFFHFIGTAAFSGTPGELRYYHSGGDTYIEMQTGNVVDIEGVIRLAGILNPQQSWFIT